MGLTHDYGLGLEPSAFHSCPRVLCVSEQQQPQSPELSAFLSPYFVQLKGRRGYWAPPLRDPSGPEGVERGQLQLFYC